MGHWALGMGSWGDVGDKGDKGDRLQQFFPALAYCLVRPGATTGEEKPDAKQVRRMATLLPQAVAGDFSPCLPHLPTPNAPYPIPHAQCPMPNAKK